MEKVAVYCRESNEERKERQSIENQIEYAKNNCKKQGNLIHDYYCEMVYRELSLLKIEKRARSFARCQGRKIQSGSSLFEDVENA